MVLYIFRNHFVLNKKIISANKIIFIIKIQVYQIQLKKSIMIIDQNQSSNTTNDQSIDNRDSFYPRQSQVHDISSITNNQININQRLIDLLKQSLQFLRHEKIQEATQSLQKVERIIQYMTKIDKPFDRKIKIVCYYNLACIFQGQWILDKCASYLAKCLQNMQIVCTSENNSSIKRSTLLVQTILQYCAILSQYGDHNRALQTAKLGIPLLKHIFEKALQQCNNLLHSHKGSDNKIQKIPFSNFVIQNAVQMLNQIITIPSFNQIKDKEFQQFAATRDKIYFWKNNPQNNQKFLRKQLGTPITKSDDSQRSLLGVQNTQNWIQTYNIGTIMHMKHIVFQQYVQEDNFIFEMSKRRLLEKVILVSVSYFSLATELRFIQIEKAKQDIIDIKQKYTKTVQYKTSQIFHLKAIEVICRFVRQNSVFINHLISSYHKHYKQNLLVIEEEASIIEYSMIYQKQPHKKKSKNIENDSNESILQLAEMAKTNFSKNGANKVMGYQPLKKRDLKNNIFNIPTKKMTNFNSSSENFQLLKTAKSFDKNLKQQSIKNKNTSTSRFKQKSESKGRSSQIMKQESFNSKMKSKSINAKYQKKSVDNSSDRKSKKSIKNDLSTKKILIQGDNEDVKITQNTLKTTLSPTANNNLQFLRKINKVSNLNTINPSTTKKNFQKKQKMITSPEQMNQILDNMNYTRK